jgi:predicted transcriptional regulator
MAFASALREASDAAFELLEVQARKENGLDGEDQIESWTREHVDALVACFDAVHRVRKMTPLVACEIDPPAGVGIDAWLAGLLTHLDLLKNGGTFLDFPDRELLPPDFRELAEYVESKKDQWTIAASELADAARHLENLAWVRTHTQSSDNKVVHAAKPPRHIKLTAATDVLPPNEASVLLALRKFQPVPLVIERIETTIQTLVREAKEQKRELQNVLVQISARTISKTLKRLVERGYVIQPNGSKGGYSITAEGLVAVEKLP